MEHKCFLIWGDRKIMSLYGVIGYHVTLWEGHMIANHYKDIIIHTI